MRLLPYSLQGRFLMGLVAIMAVMGGFFAFALHMHMQELFLSEARAKANLMVAHTEAIQRYVRDVLRPAVSHVVEPDGFVIEAMSTSFVTRHILHNLGNEGSDFTYRRVTQNARNPYSEADERERAYLGRLAADAQLQRMEDVTDMNGRKQLTVVRAVRFTPDCMHCHGDPKDAPAVLLTMYGSERGFWRQPGQLAGLDLISVPLENGAGGAGESITIFAVWFGSGMILLLLVVQGFFNRLVVHNLRRVGDILQRNFFREGDADLLAPLRKEEEIEGMVRSIESVATHLGEAREHLRQNERLAAVGQLAAGLAHEINNPLGVIRCYAELLGSAATDPQNRADLEIILRHVDQAQHVLRDLLDFARPHDACPVPCNVGALLASLMEIFRVRAAGTAMSLEVEPHLPELYLDAGMLEQVLVNLLLNALDAVSVPGSLQGEQGAIFVSAAYDGQTRQVLISIRDNGAGIGEADLPRIFDPFFTTKDPGAGSGLGLAIAFGLVRDMDGRLEAHSLHPEHGALFRVALPVPGDGKGQEDHQSGRDTTP